MPRGDGKDPGEPRKKWHYKYPLQTYVPRWLKRRYNDSSGNDFWGAHGNFHDPKDGTRMHRPGSQNRNK